MEEIPFERIRARRKPTTPPEIRLQQKKEFVRTAYLLPEDRERLGNIKLVDPKQYDRILTYLVLLLDRGYLDNVRYLTHEEFKKIARAMRTRPNYYERYKLGV